MSGHGETPDRDGAEGDESAIDPTVVDVGETLYTAEGTPVGEIRGVEEAGVFVTFREGVERLSVEHARAGHEFGEAELMWRCTNCGEMGALDEGLPDTCPNCGEPKEALMYWTED